MHERSQPSARSRSVVSTFLVPVRAGGLGGQRPSRRGFQPPARSRMPTPNRTRYEVLCRAAGAGEDTARRRASVPAAGEDTDAVDPDIADARRELVRISEGGAVGDGGGVEDDDVGGVAREQQAAVAQAEARSHRAAHLADGVFEREQAIRAHVLAEHTRVGTVSAWVSGAERRGPGGIEAAGIRGDADPGLTQAERDILLVEQEVDGADALLLRDQQVHHGINPVLAAHIGDLVESLAGILEVLRPLEAHWHDTLRAGAMRERLPAA